MYVATTFKDVFIDVCVCSMSWLCVTKNNVIHKKVTYKYPIEGFTAKLFNSFFYEFRKIWVGRALNINKINP